MTDALDPLAKAIAVAAKTAFLSLFANKERYYYCALLTTGEGHRSFVSAWSWDALEKKAAAVDDPEEAEWLKWSFADFALLRLWRRASGGA